MAVAEVPRVHNLCKKMCEERSPSTPAPWSRFFFFAAKKISQKNVRREESLDPRSMEQVFFFWYGAGFFFRSKKNFARNVRREESLDPGSIEQVSGFGFRVYDHTNSPDIARTFFSCLPPKKNIRRKT
jgi:hypothetical protein